MITIDETKCRRCSECISECPTKSLAVVNNSTIQAAPSVCLSCGHCVSVCPCNALSWSGQNGSQPFTLLNFDSTSHPEDIFYKTRSVRKFKSSKINKKVVFKLISDAESAPSADNFRRREYIVVDDSVAIDKMESLLTNRYKKAARFLTPVVIKIVSMYSKTLAAELTLAATIIHSITQRKLEEEHTIFRDAPCVIFILGPVKSLFAKEDCIAAQNYMRLAATINGIGSCIVGFAQKSNGMLEKYLNVDKNKQIYAATIFGYQENAFLKKIVYPGPLVKWV